MTDRDAAVAGIKAIREAKPSCKAKPSGAPGEPGFISDERRISDALEDDEVREALNAWHRDDRKPG